jgi:hypothetical protein
MALQAQQIVSLACQDARAPGYRSQAGELLNMILGDLCQAYDFEVARKTFYFDFNPSLVSPVPGSNSIYGSGPYPLPADYLRAAGDRSIFWTNSGVPYNLIPIDLAEFDGAVQQAGIQNYPYWYATDLSLGDEAAASQVTPQLYVYPPPSGAFPVTVRYYCQMSDIATPETSATVPWFPNQAYLRKRLAAEIMGLVDDERQDSFLNQADKLLNDYLKLKDDKSNRAQSVKLDRRRFGPNFQTLRNTKTIGW